MKPVVKITIALGVISMTLWKLADAHDSASNISRISSASQTETTASHPDAQETTSTSKPKIAKHKDDARSTPPRFLDGGLPPSQLTDAQATQEIEILERHFEDEHMIARLNSNAITQTERDRYGAMIQRVTSLKEELLVREFKKIEAEFNEISGRRAAMATQKADFHGESETN